MSIRGVILDVGGTIILSPDGLAYQQPNTAAAADKLAEWDLLRDRKSFICTLLRWQREKPKEGPDYRQINTIKEILRGVTNELEIPIDDKQLTELEIAFNTPYIQGVQPTPGIIEVINSLRGHVRLAVISNTRSHHLIEGIINRLGLLDAFDPFLTSEGFGWRKPSPKIFKAVLDHWKLETAEVAMIGDSLRKDVAAAQAMGMKGIWLRVATTDGNPGIANAIADSPGDLPGILKRLSA